MRTGVAKEFFARSGHTSRETWFARRKSIPTKPANKDTAADRKPRVHLRQAVPLPGWIGDEQPWCRYQSCQEPGSRQRLSWRTGRRKPGGGLPLHPCPEQLPRALLTFSVKKWSCRDFEAPAHERAPGGPRPRSIRDLTSQHERGTATAAAENGMPGLFAPLTRPRRPRFLCGVT